jgi:lipopolysaccharide export system protein LptC|tara:strand:+ start:879 stop:1109 length:231 start_codon:yes stop_codon:yes gene_type:complete
MIPVNRDTLSIIALVVCVAGILFLFREVNKTKQEVEQMKDFSDYVSKRLDTQESARAITTTSTVTDTETVDDKVAE